MRVLLAQLPNPQFGHIKRFGNTPLAAGYLKGMAHKAGLSERVDIEIMDHDIMNLGSDRQIIRYIQEQKPDILGFTLYLWNTERSLYLAEELKKTSPDIRVIVGGPEVAPDNEFLLKHDIIELGCHKEGELTFVDMLRYLLGDIQCLDDIPGIFFRKNGEIIFTSAREPIQDLSIIPSPFLEGYLDPSQSPVISLETSRGCHNNCKYCSWENRPHSAFPVERTGRELRLFHEAGVKHVKFINSNILAALSRDNGRLAQEVEKANKDRRMSLFGFLSAEGVTDERADMLKKLGFDFVGVGLQSVNPRTLAQIGRKPELERFVDGCRRLMTKNIGLELEYIIGLPNDSVEDYYKIHEFLKEHELLSTRNQVTPFILLMLPGTTIRREIEEHGILYNPRPPYQLIKSKYLDEHEVREAIEISDPVDSTSKYRPILLNLLCETYTTLPCEMDFTYSRKELIERLKRKSFRKIVVALNAERQTMSMAEELGHLLGELSEQSFILWFKSNNIKRDVELSMRIANSLLERNPFLILTIIWDIPLPFDKKIFNPFKQLPLKSLMIKSKRFLRPLTNCFIVPLETRSKLIEELDPQSGYCWSLKISETTDWMSDLEKIKHDDKCLGGWLDFDSSLPQKTIFKILNYLIRDDTLKTKVAFRSFELNAAFNYFHISYKRKLSAALGMEKEMTFELPRFENVLVFGDNLEEPQYLFTPDASNIEMIKKYIRLLDGISDN